MTLGEIIKEYRAGHSLSMDAFSDVSGLSKSYIAILEKNRHPKTGKPVIPSITVIRQAAAGMNVDFNDLIKQIDGDVRISSEPSSPTPLQLTQLEENIVTAFREASPERQGAVCDILHVSTEEAEGQSCFESSRAG